MHYLCFQIWGSDPTYLVGLRENLRLCPTFYPGYTILVYKDRNLSLPWLKNYPCEVIEEEDRGWYNFFWRLHFFDDRQQFETVAFRDADSRPSSKEAACHFKWQATGCEAYTMKDHPHHADPIMAGMWGIRYGVLYDVKSLIKQWLPGQQLQYGSDQKFLHHVVLPKVCKSLIRYGRKWKFPDKKVEHSNFIGEKIIIPPGTVVDEVSDADVQSGST